MRQKPEHGWVVHWQREPYDIYVGRRSRERIGWGNPFVIGVDGTREEVVEKYREYISAIPVMVEAAKHELRGKILGCWCYPLRCHGDVLAEIANGEPE